MSWREVGQGVFVRRYAELDLSIGLVVGAECALVIDTRGDHVQGSELAAAVREITALPWQVAITHAHFDHCFGTSAFLPAPVWAHERCPRFLAATADQQRAEWVAHYRGEGSDDIADALAESTPTQPDHLVSERADLDLGGRTAQLRHLGPGHTDHDLVIAVPDAGVVFAGDLVEQGAPPDFGDAHPERWPAAADGILALSPATVVPGHGDPVGPDFVRTQRAELAAIAELCREHRTGELTEEQALHRSPYPADTTRTALRRA
ncbi:MBL fold metallo-hydrolase [Saccharopolyspora sp. WRP15-2]|uniref:MBL fold metallo-hydrolase n=1 Tax=Saccharopolyspora oryzae TaxID=2997343 RepID=A0ABT4UYH4_9PSEU|nr:MBL fold metallo-hydrolase [Saccharopolyspora oryzae]MDA3626767.1 MBL fold metallo-hydrolase [Saccharopolyspora oryzae]